MQLAINLNLDNDAFVQGRWEEIKFCLDQVMDKIQHETYDGSMRDTNGNKVGNFEITGE